MKKINIIDLDNTMIPFDSFLKYLQQITFSSGFYKIIPVIIRRVLGLCSEEQFKSEIIKRARTIKGYNKIITIIKNEVINNLNESVINEINSKTNNDTINVICSASPSDYVKQIAVELNWGYISSDFREQKFVNMKNQNKIKYLLKLYPPNEYYYNYSVSDSKDDLELLKLFHEYKLIT